MRILIADDDEDDRALVSAAFMEINSQLDVSFVKDGQELIDHLKYGIADCHLLPDLVLLDLNMPRKDGREALKEIKSDPAIKNVDIIIFSTSASEQDKIYTMSLGAKNYIVKPADYSMLMHILRTISEQLCDI
jgi:DNA-binding response OmpR family regulator